jgi:hypothetical protein
MHLYRATSIQPQFSTSALEQELYDLEKERDAGPAGEFMIDAFKRMGKDRYVRYVELRQIIKDHQFFTDDKMEARNVAGDHQYLIEMEIPDDAGGAHKVLPEEVGAAGEKPAERGGNYGFTGRELAANKEAWNIVVSTIE